MLNLQTMHPCQWQQWLECAFYMKSGAGVNTGRFQGLFKLLPAWSYCFGCFTVTVTVNGAMLQLSLETSTNSAVKLLRRH